MTDASLGTGEPRPAIRLERLAGRHPGDDAWRPRFDHYVAVFESALGPQEGPPASFDAAD